MTDDRIILEADKPLSQSILWQIQRAYYLRHGMAAWQDDIVPHEISCSPVMAGMYVEMLFGYLQDCVAAGVVDAKRPFHIIELGAGSGRLTHHLLHQFIPQFEASPFAHIPLKFVLTDFVPQIVEFWQRQPKLQAWAEAGYLDFAVFDAVDLRPLQLQHSQTTLDPSQRHNPLVLLANYFFDSIPQDSFIIDDGQLCHNLLTLTSSQPEPDFTDPAIWERLLFHFEPIPLPPPYQHELDNEILALYEEQMPDMQFLFPNLGLDCLRFWQAEQPLLLLSSDRGHSHAAALVNMEEPAPNLHGSFSLQMNYHALSEYVWLQDGLPLTAAHYQDNIQICAFLWGGVPQDGWATKRAYETAVSHHSPDDLFGLRDPITAQAATMELVQLLSLLRLYRYNATLFLDCFDALWSRLSAADEVWYGDVAAAVTAVVEQHLPLTPNDLVERKANELLALLDDLAQMGMNG